MYMHCYNDIVTVLYDDQLVNKQQRMVFFQSLRPVHAETQTEVGPRPRTRIYRDNSTHPDGNVTTENATAIKGLDGDILVFLTGKEEI